MKQLEAGSRPCGASVDGTAGRGVGLARAAGALTARVGVSEAAAGSDCAGCRRRYLSLLGCPKGRAGSWEAAARPDRCIHPSFPRPSNPPQKLCLSKARVDTVGRQLPIVPKRQGEGTSRGTGPKPASSGTRAILIAAIDRGTGSFPSALYQQLSQTRNILSRLCCSFQVAAGAGGRGSLLHLPLLHKS